jgi:L-2-hydroxyglutarate oxidase LhgO
MHDTDAVIIGAGVIGLAVAREFALRGLQVVVLESERAIGMHTSSRNSEVIHAGIDYVPGSRKAKFCMEGKHLLYPYLESHGIAHRRCGKLIVACAESEIAGLQRIARTAEANGVEEMRWLTAAEARGIEPEVRCVAALHSGTTGIFDTHQYMLSLLGEAEDKGARLALSTRFTGAVPHDGGFAVRAATPEPFELSTRLLVNAAGLRATEAARMIEGLAHIRETHFARGRYFTLRGPSPFRGLVYPLPEDGGLGIHVTLDMSGAVRFGPNVEWIDRVDYSVDAALAPRFADAIRTYWPGIDVSRLDPGYAGVRPKLGGPNDPQDFALDGPAVHGIAGLMNLFGIESPGLTGSLAIAKAVADELMA